MSYHRATWITPRSPGLLIAHLDYTWLTSTSFTNRHRIPDTLRQSPCHWLALALRCWATSTDVAMETDVTSQCVA